LIHEKQIILFDSHNFCPVVFWSLGPLKNPKGYTIAIAEIDETWILRWKTPSNEDSFAYCSDHQMVIQVVKQLY
jgi:hypothetical protein